MAVKPSRPLVKLDAILTRMWKTGVAIPLQVGYKKKKPGGEAGLG
jgi:hypothetical protein